MKPCSHFSRVFVAFVLAGVECQSQAESLIIGHELTVGSVKVVKQAKEQVSQPLREPSSRRRLLVPPGYTERSGSTVVPTPVPAPLPKVEVSEVTMAGGHKLTLPQTKDGTIIIDEHAKVLQTLTSGLYVVDAKLSSDQQVALLMVRRYAGGSNWHDHLLRVTWQKDEAKLDKFMAAGTDLQPGFDWSVPEVGAISNDGNTVLLRFELSSQKDAKVRREWQTWQLDPVKQLGTGLTTDNGLVKK